MKKKVGRCLRSEGVATSKHMDDEGFDGCYSDVRHKIEPHCAGQQHCEVHVSRLEAGSGCSKVSKDHLKF